MADKLRLHLPLMLMGMLSLLAAFAGGLMRLGWGIPPAFVNLSVLHGPLMISGFLGTLISLERAVALKHRWTYLAPLLTGAGGIFLITGLHFPSGVILITLGSLSLVFIFVAIFRLQAALHTLIMGLGAFLWFAGNLLWLLGLPVYVVVLWWAGFLVLTIAGERLELSRMLQPSLGSRVSFLVTTLIILSGIVLAGFSFDAGIRLTGAGMIAVALWLFRYDIARRTVRQPGLPRFIALCLLSGYAWLSLSGLMALRYGGIVGGARYDAILHSIFLGFVFVMIFGHAPIIFPAVLGVSISFKPRFYLHLILLHLTLIVRVAGDLTGWFPGRQWGGLLNVFAILLFFANTLSATRLRSP
jgi:hypothetical protein